MRRPVAVVACSVGLTLLTACSFLPGPPRAMPVNHYFADDRDLDTVRRIMVLPFREVDGVQAPHSSIRDAFLKELAKIQRFELVPLPSGAGEARLIYESLVRGRLSHEAIVELGNRYQLDGVLMGSILAYRAYHPPHLGLQVQLVSVHSGSTIWAAEGVYDAADALTLEDLRHYASSAAAEEASFHGHEIHLIAPTKFATYVSQRLVRTWRQLR